MADMMSTLNIKISYNGQECILHNITERGIAILRNFRAPGAMYHSPTIDEIIKQNKENEALKDAYIAYKSNKAQANAEYEKLIAPAPAAPVPMDRDIMITFNGRQYIIDNITERGIASLRNYGGAGGMYHSPTIDEIIQQNKENEALKDAYIAYKLKKLNEAQANAEYEKLIAPAPPAPPVPMAVDTTNTMYLICQHGVNTAASHSLYPLSSNFSSVTYYVPPYQMLSLNKVDRIIGSCLRNPVVSKELKDGTFKAESHVHEGRRYLSLPPMLFTILTTDLTDKDYPTYEGVWKAVFTNNVVTSIRKIKPQREWLTIAFGNPDTIITQSSILKKLETIVRQEGDEPETVSIGMLSCHNQSFYPQLPNLSAHSSYTSAEKKPLLLPKESLFLSDIPAGQQLSLAGYGISGFKAGMPWVELARQRVVGCGMNVLAFYEIIEPNDARCRVTALPVQGQSIFSVYTIFYDQAITNKDTKFVVIRISFNRILKIFELLQTLPENVATFVKLYAADTIQKDGETVDSNVGHTISFIKHDGKLYLVDPQARINQPIDTSTQLLGFLNSMYGDKKFMDMVFVVRERFAETNRTIYSADDFQAQILSLGRIISMNGLHWGGKRNYNKRTHKRKNHKKNFTKVKM